MRKEADVRSTLQLLAEQHPAVLSAELFQNEGRATPRKHRAPRTIALLLRALALIAWV